MRMGTKDGEMISKPLMVDGKRRDGTIRSKGKFGAFRMHLEFKIPPTGPGNSGVYVGPYEIQVLNSFGREGSWYDCGSIYRQHPPKVNASIEPEAWQTYDIEFHPAKFDGDRLISHPDLYRLPQRRENPQRRPRILRYPPAPGPRREIPPQARKLADRAARPRQSRFVQEYMDSKSVKIKSFAAATFAAALISAQGSDIVAHRGENSQAPENSIPAFEAAFANGAKFIEGRLLSSRMRRDDMPARPGRTRKACGHQEAANEA